MLGEAVGRCMAGLTLLDQDDGVGALGIWEEEHESALLIMGSMILGMLDERGITIEDWATKAAGKEWD